MGRDHVKCGNISMNRAVAALIFGPCTLLSQVAAPQAPGLGLSDKSTAAYPQELVYMNRSSGKLDVNRNKSRGIGSGKIVLLRGEYIEDLPKAFFQDDEKNHDQALETLLNDLAPLLGNINGRQFAIETVMELPAQRLIRFHQVIGDTRLPSSSIFASKDNRITLVSFYSIAQNEAEKDMESRLTDDELTRLFNYHASGYFERIGAVQEIEDKSISGPYFRYLDLDEDNENKYQYVADFFYHGYVFIIDSKSGELITAGYMGTPQAN